MSRFEDYLEAVKSVVESEMPRITHVQFKKTSPKTWSLYFKQDGKQMILQTGDSSPSMLGSVSSKIRTIDEMPGDFVTLSKDQKDAIIKLIQSGEADSDGIKRIAPLK